MDRFSTLPFEIRIRIYSYYFNAHDRHFCMLKIGQAKPAHSEATESLIRTKSQAASKLEEHTRSSSSKITELIRQIQSTASALSAMIDAEKEAVRVGKLTSFPSVILHARAVEELSRVMDETEIAIRVQPTATCRRFFDLAHVNRRLRADLLWTCEFDLCGDMETVIKLLPSTGVEWRARIAAVHVLIGKGGPYFSKAQLQRLNSLPNLKTVYVSGMFDEGGVYGYEYSEGMAMSSRGEPTVYLLKTLERRGIRTILCLEEDSKAFMQNRVKSGTWRELVDGHVVEAEEDRERMRDFRRTEEIGPPLYVFGPGTGLDCGDLNNRVGC